MAAVIVSSGRKLSSVHRPVCRELLWLRRCLPLDNSPSVYTTFALFDYCQVKAPLRATGCGRASSSTTTCSSQIKSAKIELDVLLGQHTAPWRERSVYMDK